MLDYQVFNVLDVCGMKDNLIFCDTEGNKLYFQLDA